MRRLISWLVCACMAVQGVVPALAAEAPCPMEAEMVASVLAGELDAADLPDCCNDLQTWAETGHLCKSGLDGSGPQPGAPAPMPDRLLAAPGAAAVPGPGPTAVSAPPGAPWRPPTAG